MKGNVISKIIVKISTLCTDEVRKDLRDLFSYYKVTNFSTTISLWVDIDKFVSR